MTGSITPGAGPGRPGQPAEVLRRPADADESARASRLWWDHDADDYLAAHGSDLGPRRLQWGPEGWDEEELRLLGSVGPGCRVLEVGCGAGQGTRWAHDQGAWAVGVDVSRQMLLHARDLDGATGPAARPDSGPGRWVQADAQHLPFAAGTFDLAFSAYGALPFVPDVRVVFAEVARVLRPGSLWVFSVTHPLRWCFADDPGPNGLVVQRSYFDREAYVEEDAAGRATYVEHHHTVGDLVRGLVTSGFEVIDLVEPEWPAHGSATWGGWSPLRGRLLPGTVALVAQRRG